MEKKKRFGQSEIFTNKQAYVCKKDRLFVPMLPVSHPLSRRAAGQAKSPCWRFFESEKSTEMKPSDAPEQPWQLVFSVASLHVSASFCAAITSNVPWVAQAYVAAGMPLERPFFKILEDELAQQPDPVRCEPRQKEKLMQPMHSTRRWAH